MDKTDEDIWGRPARFIMPPNKLKEKVGSGGIPAGNLIQAQKHMDNNPEDFVPHGKKNLKRLNNLLKNLNNAEESEKAKTLSSIVQEIMDLKAHGGMFHYNLVSMIADVTLEFLEKANHLDKDSLALIEAHNKALSVILSNRLRGNGGYEGQALTIGLREACERYYEKHGIAY
ncbi:MAG: hypothetical protein H6853_08730 [Rhodospirillales bacterium]|nr:hypothetical protein [Alphaproteobacteria bacterium]USO03590.1 MAG: hypothetical protein H6853_08730 [Rhodospirillales bacterium]